MFSAVAANSQQAQNTLIRRITPIEITIAAASTSNSQSVTIDDINNCILLYGGVRLTGSGSNRNEYQPMLTITANSVVAECNATHATDRITTALLIEFMPFVVTKAEKGTVAIGAGVASVQQALIGSYDPLRTICYYMGNKCTAASQNISDCLMTVELSNNSTAITNVVARRAVSGSGTGTASFGIIEFAPGILRDILGELRPTETAKCNIVLGQTTTFTFFEMNTSPAGTTPYAAGYGIGDPSWTLNFYNGQIGGGFQADMLYADMFDSEGVTIRRNNSGSPVAGYLVASRAMISPKWIVYTDFNEFQLDKTELSDDFDISYLSSTYDGTDAPKVAFEDRIAFAYQGHLTDWAFANPDVPSATVYYDATNKLLQFKRANTSGSTVNLQTEVMFTLFV